MKAGRGGFEFAAVQAAPLSSLLAIVTDRASLDAAVAAKVGAQ